MSVSEAPSDEIPPTGFAAVARDQLPWLYSLARRLVGADRAGGPGPRLLAVPQDREEDPWPYSDSVHLDLLHSFSQDDVWSVFDRVKPMYPVPLVLVHMEGRSTRQVARMFGMAQGTVLSWLHRGRKLFEQQLWEYANEHGLLAEPKEVAR